MHKAVQLLTLIFAGAHFKTLSIVCLCQKKEEKKKRIKIESAKSKVLLRRNKYYDITIASSWQRTATYSIRVCVCVCVLESNAN